MTGKTIKPKSLLPDANVIIGAYELGIWDDLLSRISIIVPSIIAVDETLFFRKEEHSIPDPINLPLLAGMEKISIMEATAQEMQMIVHRFDRVFAEGLHGGETEALALLCRQDFSCHFCTGDAMAIKALAMLARVS